MQGQVRERNQWHQEVHDNSQRIAKGKNRLREKPPPWHGNWHTHIGGCPIKQSREDALLNRQEQGIM